MTKEDYMHLPKERLAELLAERDSLGETIEDKNQWISVEEAARTFAINIEEAIGTSPFSRETIEEMFSKTVDSILQHQWISVDEASPKEDIPNCFVAYKTFDMVFYSTGSYEKDNDEWYVDSVGFHANVTHWMPIPALP